MKQIAAFLTLVFLVSIVSASAQRRRHEHWNYGSGNYAWNPSWNNWPNPNEGACFYSTAPFRGNHFCVRAGDRIPHLPSNFGDNISSVRTFGGATVRVFNDSNYRNGSVMLRGSVPNLRDVPFRDGHTWNNRISSIIVMGGGYGQNAPGYYPPPPDNNWAYGPQNNVWNPSWNHRPDPRDGACFYSTAPFRGNHFCVRAGDRLPHLPSNFGDNISSIQIFGRATVRVFNNANFSGGSVGLRNSVADLRNVPFRGGHTWNNRISSIIVR